MINLLCRSNHFSDEEKEENELDLSVKSEAQNSTILFEPLENNHLHYGTSKIRDSYCLESYGDYELIKALNMNSPLLSSIKLYEVSFLESHPSISQLPSPSHPAPNASNDLALSQSSGVKSPSASYEAKGNENLA